MTHSRHHRDPSACDQRLIHDFLSAGQYEVEEGPFAAHLETCATCRAKLEALAGNAEDWHQAANLLRSTEFDAAGHPDYSAATLVESTGQLPPAVQSVLESLAPSEYPENLGRLGLYEITGVFGVGGMGVVLKAVDSTLDRIVAVKVMNPRLADSFQARQRFSREAKAAAAVLHPNVVPIHSVSGESALPYFVMACITGGSLQKRLDEAGPLPLVEILRIGSQIAAGLQAAHEQGLIHRDIKPENILLEEGVERVTITDFGLARAVDDNTLTRQGIITGTPRYMSPEQARGNQLDQRSDLFSLGSVLYALCTGSPPFRDDTTYGVMRQIIDETPDAVTALNPDIPEWLSRVIEKLMSKSAADRFSTAQEVHDVLEDCLRHVRQPTLNPLPMVSPRPPKKRSPLMKLSLVAGLILASAFASGPFVNKWANQAINGSDNRVRLPISAVDGYVRTMMNPACVRNPDCIFLNVGEIGENKNGLTIMPIPGGVTLIYHVYDHWSNPRRQGPFVNRLKTTAAELSIPLTEDSEVDDEGTIVGLKISTVFSGSPDTVSRDVIGLITRTFQTDADSTCRFAFENMPTRTVTSNSAGPSEATAAELTAAYDKGTHQYAGECLNNIFLAPTATASLDSVPWNADVLFTDVESIPQDELNRIRQGL